MTISELQAQRDALLAQLGSEVETISSPDGTSITYRSRVEIELAIQRLDTEIARLQAGGSDRRVFTVTTGRGFTS